MHYDHPDIIMNSLTDLFAVPAQGGKGDANMTSPYVDSASEDDLPTHEIEAN